MSKETDTNICSKLMKANIGHRDEPLHATLTNFTFHKIWICVDI